MYLWLGLLLAIVAQTQARCKTRDASWSQGEPAVTQTTPNDPLKVTVNWASLINNARCVDEFIVHYWPDRTLKSEARRVSTNDSNAVSINLPVEACLRYRFSVEYVEHDTFGTDRETTEEKVFGTTAVAALVNDSPTNFHVTYHWDSTRSVVDLRLASIAFNRDLVNNANCLDHIKVTGQEIVSRTGPPLGSQGPTGRGDSLSRQGSASSGRRQSQVFANVLPRRGGAARQVSPVQLRPPFLTDVIMINVPVEDCSQYEFRLDMMSAGKVTVGSVPRLSLPPLAEIAEFVPPPLTSVMTVTYPGRGDPVYGTNPRSGITPNCLPAYFEAYDAYTQRVEADIAEYLVRSRTATQTIADARQSLEETQELVLGKFNCTCTSPHIKFSTTDDDKREDYGEQFGHYHFGGMHAGRPYFKQMAHGHYGQQHSHGEHGHGTARPTVTTGRTRTTTTRTTTTTRRTIQNPWFLYWDNEDNQWLFGQTLGTTHHLKFGSERDTTAKCPGDVTTWKYKSSILRRWKNDDSLAVRCETNF